MMRSRVRSDDWDDHRDGGDFLTAAERRAFNQNMMLPALMGAQLGSFVWFELAFVCIGPLLLPAAAIKSNPKSPVRVTLVPPRAGARLRTARVEGTDLDLGRICGEINLITIALSGTSVWSVASCKSPLDCHPPAPRSFGTSDSISHRNTMIFHSPMPQQNHGPSAFANYQQIMKPTPTTNQLGDRQQQLRSDNSSEQKSSSACSDSEQTNASASPDSPHQSATTTTTTARKAKAKSKRVRTIFTHEQLERLEIEFAHQMYMVGQDRSRLAKSLNLTEAQVKVWFQNRRIKQRKVNQSSPSSATVPPQLYKPVDVGCNGQQQLVEQQQHTGAQTSTQTGWQNYCYFGDRRTDAAVINYMRYHHEVL